MRLAPSLSVVIVLAALLAAPVAARAESTAVVVVGDPGRVVTVTSAIAPWLERKGQRVVRDPMSKAGVDKLVNCVLIDDEACMRPAVAPIGAGRLMFAMVGDPLAGAGAVELIGWLFAVDGTLLAADRRVCERCETVGLIQASEDLAAALWRTADSRAAMLRIVSTPPGARVVVDGEPVGPTPLDYQVSPGPHEVALDLPGHEVAVRTVEVVGGTIHDLAVTLEPDRGRRGRVLPWIAIGAGALALAAGGVLVAMDEDQPPLDPGGPEPKQYFDSALGGVSLAAVGAVAVAGGVVLWLRGRDASPGSSGLVIRADANAGYIGWSGRF